MALVNYRVRNNIQRYLDQNQIPRERLRLVNIGHWQDIGRRAEEAFVDERKSPRDGLHWISLSDRFGEDAVILAAYDIRSHPDWLRSLPDLLPEPQAYLLVEDAHAKMWIYEGWVREIVRLLHEEVFDGEYCVIGKKYGWMLCVNHHDMALFVNRRGRTGFDPAAIQNLTMKEERS